jgi:hypothetical protein
LNSDPIAKKNRASFTLSSYIERKSQRAYYKKKVPGPLLLDCSKYNIYFLDDDVIINVCANVKNIINIYFSVDG